MYKKVTDSSLLEAVDEELGRLAYSFFDGHEHHTLGLGYDVYQEDDGSYLISGSTEEGKEAHLSVRVYVDNGYYFADEVEFKDYA